MYLVKCPSHSSSSFPLEAGVETWDTQLAVSDDVISSFPGIWVTGDKPTKEIEKKFLKRKKKHGYTQIMLQFLPIYSKYINYLQLQ